MANKTPHHDEKFNCPNCGFECIIDQVSIICPNCDFVKMRDNAAMQNNTIKCPSCKHHAKVYHHRPDAKTFVCEHCNTIGRYIDIHALETKKYPRSTPAGKRLSWLFEVPCRNWHKKDDPETHKKFCMKCDIRTVCNEHSEEIYRFCNKKNVDVYISQDFIEVVHK